MYCDEIQDRAADMLAEARAAEHLAKTYRHDPELYVQYSTEARTWRQAARMLK